MRHIRIPFLVFALSLILTGMAFATDIPDISTWIQITGDGSGLGGRGDVLLGGLYDVRALVDPNLPSSVASTPQSQCTLFAIVNTDGTGGQYVVGRLRFREAKRSAEVLDIDICLSPNKVWVGQICRNMNGGGIIFAPAGHEAENPYVVQPYPDPSGLCDTFTCGAFPTQGIPFRIDRIGDDTGAAAYARTEYGEFEFIAEEYADLIPGPDSRLGQLLRRIPGPSPTTDLLISGTTNQTRCLYPTGSGCAYSPNPANWVTCRPANGDTGDLLTIAATMVKPRTVGNVLEGTVYLVRPLVAISHQYNMTAVANFSVDCTGIYQRPGTYIPNLLYDVQSGIDFFGCPNPGAATSGYGFDDLEALLSKRFVDYTYVTQGYANPDSTKQFPPNENTPMSTSVVVSFPTKVYHYAVRNSQVSPYSIVTYPTPESNIPYTGNQTGSSSPNPYPFNYPFTGSRDTLGDEARAPALPTGVLDVGEFVLCNLWDRLEHAFSPPIFSPAQGCRLPYEVNIAGLYPVSPEVSGAPTATNSAPYFRNNMILYTANNYADSTHGLVPFYSGWGRIDLSPAFNNWVGDYRNYRQGRGFHVTGSAAYPPDAPFLFNFFNNIYEWYYGLPAIGLVMTEFYNAQVSGYYGNTVPWWYLVDWCGGQANSGPGTNCPAL
jgi:hypothetical protein